MNGLACAVAVVLLLSAFCGCTSRYAPQPNEATKLAGMKTCFQVNTAYDDRIGIAVDAVVVHQHGQPDIQVTLAAIASWQARGVSTGRMFFADSDSGEIYSSGRWDGASHVDDCEASPEGIVRCGGTRPYMLPTDGWSRYLEDMARRSVRGGAECIWPEEPLSHLATGYERSFRPIWEKRYSRPWSDPHKDAEATYLTGQLMTELYVQMITRVAAASKQEAAAAGRALPVMLPVHSLYSNLASGLVAPLGTSRNIQGIDAYVGQIWTGPVRWALSNYDGPNKSFFGSAYVLYDYFNEVTVGSGRKLYLLVDPVEDDPKHSWEEFRQWYFHCVAAMLMIQGVENYEIMPWPERIFLPGYETGGGTPAPEAFRTTILALTQVMQEVSAGGQWCDAQGKPAATPPGIGVVVADNTMWSRDQRRQMNRTYGLLMSLLSSGAPASSCLLERVGDAGYLDRFKVLVLSYKSCKPPAPQTNEALAQWVRRGGVLVVLGQRDELDSADMWWRRQGQPSALHHLLDLLKLQESKEGDYVVGKGHVLRRLVDPTDLVCDQTLHAGFLQLMGTARKKAGAEKGLSPQAGLVMRRGPFVIAHALHTPLEIPGPAVDLLDKDLSVVPQASLQPDQSGIYRVLPPSARGPQVVHATHRLVNRETSGPTLTFTVKGPAGTPAVARILAGSGEGSLPASSLTAAAQTADGKTVPVDLAVEGPTLRLRFANYPTGVRVTVR